MNRPAHESLAARPSDRLASPAARASSTASAGTAAGHRVAGAIARFRDESIPASVTWIGDSGSIASHAQRAAGVDERGDVERERPRLPAVDRDADNERADQAAEVAERVHAAGDDTGVVGRDVDRHRPAGAEGEIRRAPAPARAAAPWRPPAAAAVDANTSAAQVMNAAHPR